MQPDQAKFLLETFLPSLRNEHAITKRVIEAMPADKLDYRPDENGKSALELSSHIAGAEILFLRAVAEGQFDFTQRAMPDSAKTPEGLSAWYAENFAAQVAAIEKWSAEDLAKTVDFRGMFQMPAVMFLNFSMHHIIHHRGQLSVYLRPMGGKIPSIYGESYDSAAARKAAQQA